MQKITPPRLSPRLNEEDSFVRLLAENDGDVAEYQFKDELIDDVSRDFTGVHSCRFVNCNFSGCKFYKCQFSDTVFYNCDLSNVSFAGCGFHRVTFTDCKLVGTQLPESLFNHTVFRNCRADYMVLSMSKIRHSLWVDSGLRGAAFDNCALVQSQFSRCQLIEAEFHRTALKEMDLSDSDIRGIRLSAVPAGELKGATVTSLQALDLARLLGIIIKE